MKTKIITYLEKQYLKVDLEEIKQKDNSFFLAKINSKDFLTVFTVRPAEYDLEKNTSLADSFPDEAEYYEHLILDDKNKLQDKNFQREANDERISKIVKFIENEDYAFFPNTIIANCDLINDLEGFGINENNSEEDFLNLENKPESISFLKKEKDQYYLYIPYISKTVLVIDGQHRLEGLKKTSEDIQEQYDLIISFIIGFDRSVIAKQFYTINYEQKSVNKSLLYQLTGEFSREINELTFMHNATKLLNELKDSPFYSRIKMLGKAPKNATPEDKEKMSISQAFFIDSTIRFVSAKAKGTLSPPIFLKYYLNPSEHIYIIKTIARYFTAVKKIKPDWDTPKESVLSKGMGVTALLRVLNILFPMIFKNELHNNWSMIDNLKVEDFERILKGLENVDFSTNGPYGKTGSAGSITKIKNDILSKLEYISKPQDILLFEKEISTNYTLSFNELLNEVIKK
ncbi:DGQHR domain-containing protein [Flavobacterium plurextorum]|uniref:DGQHR domain-containing protein n=1 Tax=Flavobacterium plurextorum TaxID=1114867 RepID=UPI003757E41D